MPNPVARIGDSSSHGGHIISGSSKLIVDGLGAARNADSHVCPVTGHGTTPIIATICQSFVDGRRIAVVGDTTGCGATLTTGSPKTKKL